MEKTEIRCRGFVFDGAGEYRCVEDLSPEERAELGRELAERMGRALNDHYSQHPEDYKRI